MNLSTDAILAFIGGLAGLGIALVFGVSFVRGTARVDIARFFKVTGVVLFILAAQLLIGVCTSSASAGRCRSAAARCGSSGRS